MAQDDVAAILRGLLDAGSFAPLPVPTAPERAACLETRGTEPAYDGVVTGLGAVNGQPVVVFAQDPAFKGGSIGVEHGRAIVAAQRYALEHRLPIIGLWQGGGARLQDGVHALTAVGEIFHNIVQSRGVIPQLSVVLGPCAGAACYAPALMDFLIMAADQGKMFLTGPAVTLDFIGEQATTDELGGPGVHAHNGVADFVAPDAASALAFARQLLPYLTVSTTGDGGFDGRRASRCRSTDHHHPDPTRPAISIPESPTQPYDVRGVLTSIFDTESWLELQPDFAPNLVTGLALLEGQPVAIVASQPQVLAGTIDAAAAEKGARFITTVARLGIMIISFEDVPGFFPGVAQEKAGIIRHGANLVSAYIQAQVPKITILMRKGYGGAYIALNSKAIGATAVYAWPNAEVSVMGAAGAVDVIHHRALAALPDAEARQLRMKLITEFTASSPGLSEALATGQIDAIIQSDQTRDVLIRFCIFAPKALVQNDVGGRSCRMTR